MAVIDIEEIRRRRTRNHRALKYGGLGPRKHDRLRIEGEMRVLTEIEMMNDAKPLGVIAADVVAAAREQMTDAHVRRMQRRFWIALTILIVSTLTAGFCVGALLAMRGL